jgi:glutamate synthase domain-containing protein 2
MGISTCMSYCAQIFAVIGLNKSPGRQVFQGTSSNMEGIGIRWPRKPCIPGLRQRSILADTLDAPAAGTLSGADESTCGRRMRSATKLQHSTRSNLSSYKEYARCINDQAAAT